MLTLLVNVDAIRARDPVAQTGGLALDFVTKMINASLALFLVVRDVDDYVLATVKADPILDADPDTLARDYLACVSHESDPLLSCVRDQTRANLVETEQLTATPGFETSRLNEDFFGGHGLGPVLALSTWDESSHQRCILLLARLREESEFKDREKIFLRQVAPLLTQSYHCAMGFGGTAAPMPGSVAAKLTPREMEIARLAASGARNCEIAESLHIESGTVKVHMHNVYAKLGINSRVHLALVLGVSY
ncbi:MAG: hypothetical protein J0H98_06880 [Solirubrobacterales bacterium]|nr:hypothetical protein [Solirubrobacterales bacterium]